ncbi:MAG: hypothetical protein KHY83_06070 [Coriobacteriia bacterium]|nr:hypothetical protein [Coriobacteriia bacterium]MBS5478216.1 hypothetical protein [Coriobacteriia bacterium]
MVSAIEPLAEFKDVQFARRHPIAFYLVCAREHPLASKDQVGIGDLNGETIYLLDVQPNRHLIREYNVGFVWLKSREDERLRTFVERSREV